MFEFTEEQKMLRNSIRKMVEKEFNAEWARKVDEEDRFPREVLPKLAQLDVLGLTFGEEYGGMGRDIVAATIVLEELARRSIALAWVYVAAAFFGGENLGQLATEEQRQRYLPRVASGEICFAYGLTEPDAGSDTASVKTFARREGDKFIINGTKTFISGGTAADYMITLVRTNKDVPKHKGLSFFVIPLNAPGVSAKPIPKIGVHGSDTCEVVLEDVEVGISELLGGEQNINNGWKQLLSLLDVEHIHIAAECVGLAQGAYEATARYISERKQFDMPIANFQVIQHGMADNYTQLTAARLLTYYAADLANRNEDCWKESAMAKLFTSEVAKKIALDGVQYHGGYGYASEYDIQRYMRDSIVMTIGGGTSQAQRNIIWGALAKEI
ncbi:acyl-CoA dehydrogenase family protein [Syntrophomonas curvata]